MNPRVILITGANGGFGSALAETFLSEAPDNFVWLAVRTNRAKADAMAGAHCDRVACVELDVTRPESWASAVDQILSRHQRLDVLVNHAGGHEDGLLATMPLGVWQRVLDVNLNGVFHGCQAVLPTMINQRHGRIVNVASLSALLAPAGQANYAAAKAGVVAMTQSLAKEVARLGITVNAVCPGYVDTDSLAPLAPEERKALVARIPMRRFGTPAEIAAAVRFLACADAGYVTGCALKIDGGIF